MIERRAAGKRYSIELKHCNLSFRRLGARLGYMGWLTDTRESSSSPTQSVPSNVDPLVSQMAVMISSCSETPSPMMSGMTPHSIMLVAATCSCVVCSFHGQADGMDVPHTRKSMSLEAQRTT